MGAFHDHEPVDIRRRAQHRLRWAFVFTFLLFAVELVGGMLTHSLALLSDAGHMFADLLSLSITLVSIYWATKPATAQKSFGYYRLEILATLVNGGLLLFVGIQILWAAGNRLLHPEAIQTEIMLPIALAGLLVNVISIFLLHKEWDHLATRSAFLHVVGDTLSSVGVVVAALILRFTGWLPVDAVVSAMISVLIIITGVRLLKEAVEILLEASPAHISIEKVRHAILGVGGVEGVHDLHIWTISSGFHAASAHLLVKNMHTQESDMIVKKVSERLKQDYAIEHVTLQVEPSPTPAKIQSAPH